MKLFYVVTETPEDGHEYLIAMSKFPSKEKAKAFIVEHGGGPDERVRCILEITPATVDLLPARIIREMEKIAGGEPAHKAH